MNLFEYKTSDGQTHNCNGNISVNSNGHLEVSNLDTDTAVIKDWIEYSILLKDDVPVGETVVNKSVTVKPAEPGNHNYVVRYGEKKDITVMSAKVGMAADTFGLQTSLQFKKGKEVVCEFPAAQWHMWNKLMTVAEANGLQQFNVQYGTNEAFTATAETVEAKDGYLYFKVKSEVVAVFNVGHWYVWHKIESK